MTGYSMSTPSAGVSTYLRRNGPCKQELWFRCSDVSNAKPFVHIYNMKVDKRLVACWLGIIVWLAPITGYAQVDIDKIDRYTAQAQQDWDVPGMAVGIIKDGEVVLSEGYGVLKRGTDTPVDGNSVFAIASNTKAFIAAALGILVDEGRLSWDDPVRAYLPYFQLYDAYATAHTTIRDLLSHRVGLGTFSGDVIWYKRTWSAQEILQRLPHVPQAYEYRAGYGYTNLMFIAAGEVIRTVSGQSWDAFLKDRIFEPTGMHRTRTSVEALHSIMNVAQPHKPVDGENRPIPYVNWDNMGAAGGILSSTNDMLKWIDLQLDGGIVGEDTVFSARAQAEFWHPHNINRVSDRDRASYRNRNFAGYALGWSFHDYAGRRVMNHGGGYDGMYSKVAIVPEENLGIVILTNTMKGISNPLQYYILDAYLGQEEQDWSAMGLKQQEASVKRRKALIEERINRRVMDTKTDIPPAAFAGVYRCPMYGDLEVTATGDGLTLHFDQAPELDADLTHWHFNTYRINWQNEHAWFDFGTVQFVLDNNGDVRSLRFDVPNGDIFFEEIQAVRVDAG